MRNFRSSHNELVFIWEQNSFSPISWDPSTSWQAQAVQEQDFLAVPSNITLSSPFINDYFYLPKLERLCYTWGKALTQTLHINNWDRRAFALDTQYPTARAQAGTMWRIEV